MDEVTNPITERVVFKKSAQVGGTEVLLNIIGFYIHHDPSPILCIQPTIEIAQAFSKDRLAPMIRDTTAITGLVKDVKSRDSSNTLLHKTFPGGHVTLAGANSPASLASRPIRVTLFDEVDRFPLSAGTEGDPVSLGRKRSQTFWNRKSIEVSTPTVKHESRIEKSYDASDQREYFMPCPHCEELMLFKWAMMKWDKKTVDGKKVHDPKTAFIVHESCGGVIRNEDKYAMLQQGEWIAQNPESSVAGFWINELYSPWSSFSEVVESFLEKYKDPEQLKTWVNTCLGETYEESSESLDAEGLFSRREEYDQDVPEPVLAITVGVDVQRDRLELEFIGWGDGFESWPLEYKILFGDPKLPEVWEKLTYELRKDFIKYDRDNRPIVMQCVGGFIDSGDGENTQIIYDYCQRRPIHNFFPTKGDGNDHTRPIANQRDLIGYPVKRKVIMIGVTNAKNLAFSYLMQSEKGPGYCHFPIQYDREYFDQLTAEKVRTKLVRGFARREWVKTRPRNEVWDIRILNLAFIKIYEPNWELLKNKYLRSLPINENKEYTDVATKPARKTKVNIDFLRLKD